MCVAFRERGHEAFSCDIQPCSGGHPEWHIQGDALPLLNGHSAFVTTDGTPHHISGKWDLIIAHPPCTYLTVTGNRWFNIERYGEEAVKRHHLREDAARFFMEFINADCERIAVENPIGYMSTVYRKPDQIIHPWQFRLTEDEAVSKSTCLWLKGLTPLRPLYTDPPPLEYKEWDDAKSGRHKRQPLWYYKAFASARTQEERARIRSTTYLGVAHAMSTQWG